MTTQATPRNRREAAALREEATPFVDEVTARGVSMEEMPRQEPPTIEDAPAGVSETKPGYLRIYKRVEYGWKPVTVARGSVEACIESGAFRFECGDCGGHCGPLPNDCPKRTPIKFARCPVTTCRKAVWDTVEQVDEEEGEPDPNEVVLSNMASTADARLRVKINRHLRFAHLSVAEEMGVAADPFLVPNAHAIANAMQPAVPFPVHPSERG